jgi:hypothetical protein
MLENELKWFFETHREILRKGDSKGYEMVMLMSLAHIFGYDTAKELADHLDIPHQGLYKHLKRFSLYQLKKLLLRFMVKQAAPELKAVLDKSASTKSRANIGLHGDNSVIQRWGKLIRLIYPWYSGRAKKVVLGNDLLGMVLTINDKIIPLHLLFVSKQGRANTNKPDILLKMLKELKVLFAEEGIDITQFPLTLDSWFASQDLREKLAEAGFEKVIVAGKSVYTFTIGKEKHKAKEWKRKLKLLGYEWGVDVPCCRELAYSPTFKEVVLFFFKKSTTKVFYLMDFSKKPGRCIEIWRTWQKHHSIEQFWRLLKSLLHLNSIQLRGDGLYAGLLIKILTCILLLRLKSLKTFRKLSFLQIMRKIRREENFKILAYEHFHGLFSAT